MTRPGAVPPPRSGGARRRRLLPAANLAAVVLISLLDWVTPAGVVVGILASLPIVAASFTDSRQQVLLTFWTAAAGFILAAVYGEGPLSPAPAWAVNRVFAFLALPASCAFSLMLQERRLDAVRARDDAVASGELNRLLAALLAHDLRAPLLLASQGFSYVRDMVTAGGTPDPVILTELGARLQRSLRGIDAVLAITPADSAERPAAAAAQPRPAVDVRREIEEEVASFALEAEARGKVLAADLGALDGRWHRIDARVLRQGLAVLVDNAIRHAVPGAIRVSAEAAPGELRLRVEDAGPAGPAGRPAPGRAGTGLGLELCRALAAHEGGSLERERHGPGGTTFLLRLPAAPAQGDEAVPREGLPAGHEKTLPRAGGG